MLCDCVAGGVIMRRSVLELSAVRLEAGLFHLGSPTNILLLLIAALAFLASVQRSGTVGKMP